MDLCGAPRCTAPHTTDIHVAGNSSILQLPASAGCQHAAPSLGELRTILRGSWLMICGSSNSRIQFMNFANAILPGSIDFTYKWTRRRPTSAARRARARRPPALGPWL